MKQAVVLLLMLSGFPAVYAGEQPAAAAVQKEESRILATENGVFELEMKVSGTGLKTGPNSLDIKIRDNTGKAVMGAAVTVKPWMPMMGHGVWEKPAVTERGGGSYHVENVIISMNGLWALKIEISKDDREDQATFTFYVTEE